MNKLSVKNIRFNSIINETKVADILMAFTFEFEFGKLYGIDSDNGYGAWALSWIISGANLPSQGTISLDGNELAARQLRNISWLVRHDEIKRFGLIHQSVKAQIRAGLTHNKDDNFLQSFHLTPERYNRKLSQLSSEAWSASCAIGFAHNKKIFCFPYMRTNFISEYRSLWLEEMLNFLKSSGALILFPSMMSENEATMFDNVIRLGNRL